MTSRTVRPKLRNKPAAKRPIVKTLDPVSPGELLLEEFLVPMNMTAYRLAKEIGVPATRIGEILNGRRGITADTDLRLCKVFGLSEGYWLRAQAAYDLEISRANIAKDLIRIKTWKHPIEKSKQK